MRIAVTGATGNCGTALVRSLVADDQVEEVIGIARRLPAWRPAKTNWVSADITRDELVSHFDGVDAVVHLAWLIQPSRNQAITDRVNLHGTRRVFEAAAQAGVGALIHASSVAAYAPADPSLRVDESWPTTGIPSSYYSRQKVEAERILDDIEARFPDLRVARARPALIFQRAAAAAIRRYFAGPLLPRWAVRPGLIPIVPQMPGLAGQLVHADDIGDLYRRLCLNPDARGAFNVAAAPPLDAKGLGHLLGARPVDVPARFVRAAMKATWKAHLHPVSPDWLDVGLNVPVMDTTRAQSELGWTPTHTSGQTLMELLDGLREGAGFNTPVLAPDAGGPMRIRELLTGIGGPNPLDRKARA